MSDPKFTPGEWFAGTREVDPGEWDDDCSVWVAPAAEEIAADPWCEPHEVARCSHRGDVRLVAAAPNLLAALEAILSCYDEALATGRPVTLSGATIDTARAAIHKAKGETSCP